MSLGQVLRHLTFFTILKCLFSSKSKSKMRLLPVSLISLLLASLSSNVVANIGDATAIAAAEAFFTKHANETTEGSTSGHTNNWAVLVCASRYWFNYRVSSFFISIKYGESNLKRLC